MGVGGGECRGVACLATAITSRRVETHPSEGRGPG